MTTNEEGIALLKHFEAGGGFVEKAYWDKLGKVWTVGWGFTKGVDKDTFMTEEEGNIRLVEELKDYEENVTSCCTVEPNSNQFSAMVCLSWNIGMKGFSKSDVLKFHNLGEVERAAEAFLNWTSSGGIKNVPGLVRRRKAEATLYLK